MSLNDLKSVNLFFHNELVEINRKISKYLRKKQKLEPSDPQVATLNQQIELYEDQKQKFMTEKDKITNYINTVAKNKIKITSPSKCLNTSYCMSEELAAFLNKPRTMNAERTSIYKWVMEYIRTNNLLNKETKLITPDTALQKLFKLEDGQIFKWFEVQRYIVQHITAQPTCTAYSYSVLENGECTPLHIYK